MLARLAPLLFLVPLVFAQTEVGELRLALTDAEGDVTAKRLPFGIYIPKILYPGFTPVSEAVEIRSAIPKELTVELGLEHVKTTVSVNENANLIDPANTSGSIQIRSPTLQDRLTAMPGLFSGTAMAVSRRVTARLQVNF